MQKNQLLNKRNRKCSFVLLEDKMKAKFDHCSNSFYFSGYPKVLKSTIVIFEIEYEMCAVS